LTNKVTMTVMVTRISIATIKSFVTMVTERKKTLSLEAKYPHTYRDADKSLARPGRKQATLPTFYGIWSFITTFTRFHHLSLPQPKSIHFSAPQSLDKRNLFPFLVGLRTYQHHG
jgi:hypothetical protein